MKCERKIGFIGIGHMGKPMATNLINAGYDVYVFNRSKPAVIAMTKLGAHPCKTKQELAKNSDLIFASLPNDAVVEDAMTGPKGIFSACKEGTVVIDTSSVAPATSRKIAEIASQMKIKYVDAPVSGGTAGAAAGTLTIMVGADNNTYEEIFPFLKVIGKNIYHVGETGLGCAIKIVNNLLLGCNMASLAEALVLGAKCGLNPQVMYDIISVSSGNSYVMDAKMQKFIMNGKFEGGFMVNLQYKDLGLAMNTGREDMVPLPMTSTAVQVFEAARAEGFGKEDISSVIKVWEKLAGIEVRK